jgi:hypothetical protein
MWVASPSKYETLNHNTLPVLPAHGHFMKRVAPNLGVILLPVRTSTLSVLAAARFDRVAEVF